MQQQSVGRDELSRRIWPKASVPCIGELTAWQQDLKKALSINRDVVVVACVLFNPFGEDLCDGGRSNTATNLNSSWNFIAGRALSPGCANCLIHQILKLDLTAFEARGIDVGEVVGGRIDDRLVRDHSRGSGVQ